MSAEIDLLSPSDKPALISASNGDLLEASKGALLELGYKVHSVSDPGEFSSRFAQAAYQVVILEESASPPESDSALRILKMMPMNQRRHATTILIGDGFQTLNPMQAFQQSVHAVINRTDLGQLPEIFQKVISDNDLFYGIYRDTQLRTAEGK